MAQGKVYRNCSSLTTPPAIQGPEVSATWRRTSRADVLMTVWMPQDTVDSEVYVKTPRGHSAVTMDPWTSSTWSKPWNKHHTPNRVTKDKLNRFVQWKTHKGISLNKTARRQGQNRRSSWSPKPTRKYNPRALGLISGPCPSHSSRQVQLNNIRKEEDEECSPNPRKRAREGTPFTIHEAPLVVSSDEEEYQDKTSPISPPDHEKGHSTVHEYEPKSLVYPPPSDSSDEEDSMPDLETPEEGMSPVPDHSNDSGYETQGSAPADVNANQDSFQDKDRQRTLAQALEKELHGAPWQKESVKGPLEDLEKITKVAKPIYDGFWCDRDQEIINRLDQAAKRLKEKRAAQLQDNQEDDTAIPVTSNLEKSCSLCNEPIGHHVLQCSKETLQDTLKEDIHSTSVEPLTGPPMIGTVYLNIPLSSVNHCNVFLPYRITPQSSLGATLGVHMSVTAYWNLSTMSWVWPIGTTRLNLVPTPLSI